MNALQKISEETPVTVKVGVVAILLSTALAGHVTWTFGHEGRITKIESAEELRTKQLDRIEDKLDRLMEIRP